MLLKLRFGVSYENKSTYVDWDDEESGRLLGTYKNKRLILDYGVTELCGKPAGGKTTMALSLASGLHMHEKTPIRVIVIDTELSITKERIRAAVGSRDDLEIDLLKVSTPTELRKLILNLPKIILDVTTPLIILDSISYPAKVMIHCYDDLDAHIKWIRHLNYIGIKYRTSIIVSNSLTAWYQQNMRPCLGSKYCSIINRRVYISNSGSHTYKNASISSAAESMYTERVGQDLESSYHD